MSGYVTRSMTLDQVAAKLGVSPQYVHQVERRALRKIRDGFLELGVGVPEALEAWRSCPMLTPGARRARRRSGG